MIDFPNCKINLGLNITAKRHDGYHDLETVFYPIPLEDVLEVVPRQQGGDTADKCTLTQYGNAIDCDTEKNLVVKAYRLLDSLYGLPPTDIFLHKSIPSGAGLGGGSADAAFMLRMLDEAYHINIGTSRLEEYAARLGADCAFFIQDRPAFATGIGDRLAPVELDLHGWQIAIVKPDIFVSTKEAFAGIRPQTPSTSLLDIIGMPVSRWRGLMVNDFEESIFPQHPEIKAIKEAMYGWGATYASMSGSGSSVYGLFPHDAPLPDLTSLSKNNFCFTATL